MAAYLTLTLKGENHPAEFQQIDNEMRKAFSQPADTAHWLWGWYDVLGLPLAMGKNWAWLREKVEDENLLRAIDWLESRYEVDCWAGR